ncbi:MAG: hypothetical protein HUU16_08250 [Candidatus Omnitrophica bacterium]|nr:hypothetical protein [Candidatus Omnitrophota bacterium]
MSRTDVGDFPSQIRIRPRKEENFRTEDRLYLLTPRTRFAIREVTTASLIESFLSDAAAQPVSPSATYTFTSQGTLLTLRMEGSNGVMREIVLDSAQAGNLARYTCEGGLYGFDEEVSFEYQEISGCFVPSHRRGVSTIAFQQGMTQTREEEFRFTYDSVNQPIPPDVFSEASLGAREGDWVRDAIQGLERQYIPPASDD